MTFRMDLVRAKFTIALFLALTVSACSATSSPQAALPPLKVLFVGNSFTYYNNSLHNHLGQLVKAANDGKRGGRMRALTLSGARLAEHLPGFADRLSSAEWDWVVLQGHSREAYDGDVETFRSTVNEMAKIVTQGGGKPALFMTWAYADEPEMTGVISTNYLLAGASANAPVVPVGLAFDRAGKVAPQIALRTADKRHPTQAGTYLAACVFFSWLYQQPATGLDYDPGLGSEVAAQLQQIATDTVSQFRGAHMAQ